MARALGGASALVALVALAPRCMIHIAGGCPDEGSPCPAATAPDGSEPDGSGPDGSCDAAALEDDPRNCGACGHDCLGGACKAQRCQPVVIGTSDDAPVLDLVVDGTNVLWMSGGGLGALGSLYACPKTGCNGAPPAILKGHIPTGSLTSDGTTAYATFFLGSAGTMRIEEPGLTLTPFTAVHGEARARYVAGDGLYLMAYYEPADAGSLVRSVFRAPDTTTETRVAAYLDDDRSDCNVDEFVVTGSRVYFGSHDKDRIFSCTKNDCTKWQTITTASGQALVTSMTRDDQRLIWVTYGHVYSCPLDVDSCVPKEELGTAKLGSGAAVSVTYAAGRLVVTTTVGDLLACDTTDCGGTLVTIAHESALDTTIAQKDIGHNATADDRAFYWVAVDTASDGGQTRRVMKVSR
jgi:hypothetical protein